MVLFALGATLFSGLSDTLTKMAMDGGSRYKAIVYAYAALVLPLVLGALALGLPFSFPAELIPAFIAQSVIGAAAVAALFKAFQHGKASVLAPLSTSYILIVMAIGIFFFGETLSLLQFGGAALVLLAAMVLAFEEIRSFRLEKGAAYLLITVIGWGYYYSFIKLFIPALGAYMATVYLELGVSLFVVLYYLARGRDLSLPSREQGGLIAVRGIAVFLATVLYTFSVAELGVALTSVIVAATPLVSVPSSYFLLGERLSLPKYAAAILIVLGLVLVLA
ncbi:MAG: EamA family transporter [Candidatus Micrarchaeota archaeon]